MPTTKGNKIWVVGSKTFYTESGFNKYVRNSFGDIKVRVFECVEETTTKEVNDNIESEIKRKRRDERFAKLLDGDYDPTYENIDKVCEMIKKWYKDTNTTMYRNHGLSKALNYKDSPDQFKRIISLSNERRGIMNKNNLLNKVCSTVEDYELVLSIHNFRPSSIEGEDRLTAFNQAKENLKKSK